MGSKKAKTKASKKKKKESKKDNKDYGVHDSSGNWQGGRSFNVDAGYSTSGWQGGD